MLKPDGRHLDGELVPPSRAPSRGSVRAPLVSLRVCNTVCVKRHLCRTRSYWDTAQGKCTRDMMYMIHAVSTTVQLLHAAWSEEEARGREERGSRYRCRHRHWYRYRYSVAVQRPLRLRTSSTVCRRPEEVGDRGMWTVRNAYVHRGPIREI